MNATDRKEGRVRVLSTAHLSDQLIEQAASNGVDVHVIPFIKVEKNADPAIDTVIAQIASHSATVIFSSTNAVEAVLSRLGDHVPDWTIYCVGSSTREVIEHYFGSDVGGCAKNAAELAHMIIDHEKQIEVNFFCGNDRRDELPQMLGKAGIHVKEIIVYRTIETSVQIMDRFDAVLFFSPSAVRSFFNSNSLPVNTVVFAIGSTTATELLGHASHVVVAEAPSRERMLRTVIDFYTTEARRAK
ncbi:MAG: uroporphyrinogen-III synthase [Bacteroidota bacterium]|nr:uroporphyrinogen-III synthase [Bacteroidota bacterium]